MKVLERGGETYVSKEVAANFLGVEKGELGLYVNESVNERKLRTVTEGGKRFYHAGDVVKIYALQNAVIGELTDTVYIGHAAKVLGTTPTGLRDYIARVGGPRRNLGGREALNAKDVIDFLVEMERAAGSAASEPTPEAPPASAPVPAAAPASAHSPITPTTPTPAPAAPPTPSPSTPAAPSAPAAPVAPASPHAPIITTPPMRPAPRSPATPVPGSVAPTPTSTSTTAPAPGPAPIPAPIPVPTRPTTPTPAPTTPPVPGPTAPPAPTPAPGPAGPARRRGLLKNGMYVAGAIALTAATAIGTYMLHGEEEASIYRRGNIPYASIIRMKDQELGVTLNGEPKLEFDGYIDRNINGVQDSDELPLHFRVVKSRNITTRESAEAEITRVAERLAKKRYMNLDPIRFLGDSNLTTTLSPDADHPNGTILIPVEYVGFVEDPMEILDSQRKIKELEKQIEELQGN